MCDALRKPAGFIPQKLYSLGEQREHVPACGAQRGEECTCVAQVYRERAGALAHETQDEFFARRHEEKESMNRVMERSAPLPPYVSPLILARDVQPDQPEDVANHGVKFDRGKPRMSVLPMGWVMELAHETELAQKAGHSVRLDLIPADVLVQLGVLYGVGAKKYDDRNWEKGFAWSRSYDAAHRHLKDFWETEDIDPETKVSHAIGVIWNAVALAWFQLHRPQFDDRPLTKKEAA